MRYFRTHEVEVKAIMATCGLSPHMIRGLTGHLASLERSNGIHFVVNVLKDRYLALFTGVDGFARKGGLWVGPFRPLSLIAKRGRRGLAAALSVLKLHGLFHAKAATSRDYQKAKDELASRADVHCLFISELPSSIKDLARRMHHRYDDTYPMSSRKMPVGKKTLPECWALPTDHVKSMDMFPSLVSEHYSMFYELIGDMLPDKKHFLDLQRYRRSWRWRRGRKLPASDCAGRAVYLVKDGSLKLRLIANTNRILQLACSPVHHFSMGLLREYPTCFVYNQQEGVDWISDQFRQGHRLSSIDLQSASDNIPMWPQIRFVSEVRPDLAEPLSVFAKVARMSWLTPSDFNIRWNCGTPMGVKGSFGMFTLFLIKLFEDIGATGKFAIVGDDLVVHSIFTSEFLKMLNAYKIPISIGKSLFDHAKYAEFCGRIITASGPLRVMKASSFRSNNDYASLLRRYGPRALRYFPRETLSNSSRRNMIHFLQLEREGILDARSSLIDPDPPKYYSGGLTARQLVSLNPNMSASLIEELVPPTEKEARDTRWAKVNYETRLYELSRSAIRQMELSGKTISAWKFRLNNPHLADIENTLESVAAEEEDIFSTLAAIGLNMDEIVRDEDRVRSVRPKEGLDQRAHNVLESELHAMNGEVEGFDESLFRPTKITTVKEMDLVVASNVSFLRRTVTVANHYLKVLWFKLVRPKK